MLDAFLGQVQGELNRGILTSIVLTEGLDLSSTQLYHQGFPLSEPLKYFTFVL